MTTGVILQIQEAANLLTGTSNEGEITLPIIDLVMKGGWIMGIIGLLSVIAVYIFIERFFVIGRAKKEDKGFMNNIRSYILDGKLESAQALCLTNNSTFVKDNNAAELQRGTITYNFILMK